MSQIIVRVRCATHRSKLMRKLEQARKAASSIFVNRSGVGGEVQIMQSCDCTYTIDFEDADLAEAFASRLSGGMQ